jgi:hypothetical protein
MSRSRGDGCGSAGGDGGGDGGGQIRLRDTNPALRSESSSELRPQVACIFIGVEWRALIDTGWPPEQQPHAAGWVVADCVAGAGSLLAAGSSE